MLAHLDARLLGCSLTWMLASWMLAYDYSLTLPYWDLPSMLPLFTPFSGLTHSLTDSLTHSFCLLPCGSVNIFEFMCSHWKRNDCEQPRLQSSLETRPQSNESHHQKPKSDFFPFMFKSKQLSSQAKQLSSYAAKLLKALSGCVESRAVRGNR